MSQCFFQKNICVLDELRNGIPVDETIMLGLRESWAPHGSSRMLPVIAEELCALNMEGMFPRWWSRLAHLWARSKGERFGTFPGGELACAINHHPYVHPSTWILLVLMYPALFRNYFYRLCKWGVEYLNSDKGSGLGDTLTGITQSPLILLDEKGNVPLVFCEMWEALQTQPHFDTIRKGEDDVISQGNVWQVYMMSIDTGDSKSVPIAVETGSQLVPNSPWCGKL